MPLSLRCLCSLLFLCLPVAALAQVGFDPAARVAAIAPFLDEHTIAVGHVDLRRLDPAAAIKTIGDLAPADDLDFQKRLVEMEAGLKSMLRAFEQIGVSDVYLVVSIADVPQSPPFLVAPVRAGGKAEEAEAVLHQMAPAGACGDSRCCRFWLGSDDRAAEDAEGHAAAGTGQGFRSGW